jgi:hypothetical protein
LHGLSWYWIAVAVTGPPIVGGLVAYPIWLKGESILGNVAGTMVIFGAAVALIARERVMLDQLVLECIDQGLLTCRPDPTYFMRYAIYSFIALAEVIALFSYSLKVEHRLRRRGYDPEWR